MCRAAAGSDFRPLVETERHLRVVMYEALVPFENRRREMIRKGNTALPVGTMLMSR